MKTELKELENLVIEISSLSDWILTEKGEESEESHINPEKDYFYSRKDNQIHKAKGWLSHRYYDENYTSHIDKHVHKVLAISDNTKYPELPLLRTFDFFVNNTNT